MCLPHAARQGAGDGDASSGGQTGLLPIDVGEELCVQYIGWLFTEQKLQISFL